MNLTLPLLALPLTLVYNELSFFMSKMVERSADYRVIKVKIIHCSQDELMHTVIRLMSSYEIPVIVSTGLEDIDAYPDALEVIFSDEFDVETVMANQSSYRIYLLHSRGEFEKAIDMVKGWVLIFVWSTGEVYCRNPLLGYWVHSFSLCKWATARNYNQRRVTVYAPTDKFSHVETRESGIHILAGFKGLLLYELKKHLNVTFQYVLQSEFSNTSQSPLREYQTFIKPLRGVYMGRMNDRVYVLKEGDDVNTELSFWGNPFQQTAKYRPIALGSMNDLTAYYGPPTLKTGIFPLLQINHNYALLLGLLGLAFILIVTKVLFSSHHPSFGNLVFYFISQCLGHTRNREYTRPFAKILLTSAFFLAYLLWVFNCATLFSILATQRFETFKDYAELNRSNRDIYITRTTLDKYSDVPAILSFRNLRIIDSEDMRTMIYLNNTGKAFLLETQSISRESASQIRNQMRRMKSQFVSQMPSYGVSRASPVWKLTEDFLQRMFQSGILQRYKHWSDWFANHKTKGDLKEPGSVDIFKFWVIIRFFAACWIASIAAFVGELLLHRWQMRRN